MKKFLKALGISISIVGAFALIEFLGLMLIDYLVHNFTGIQLGTGIASIAVVVGTYIVYINLEDVKPRKRVKK